MPARTLLSDDLLRQLIAVGHVDVLVGLPSLDNADSIAGVVTAVHAGIHRHLVRERVVLVNADGGSTDGTPEIVRGAAHGEADTMSFGHSLRTQHRISTPYHGMPGRGTALRQLFAMAELVQARAVVVLDPEVTSVAPEWVPALVRPVLQNESDFVAPIYARHPLEGPLVTQLVRPLVRSAYGARLLEPVGGEFACAGPFATRMLRALPWDEPEVRDAPDIALVGEALAGGQRVAQAALGPRQLAPRPSRPPLPEVFRQVLGAVLHGLERHEAHWTARTGSEPVATFGEPGPPAGAPPALDAAALAAAAREGVEDLVPVLENVLDAEALAAARAAAAASPAAFDDALWVRIVHAFVAAHHRGSMPPEHLVQALVPLYLGRTAAFVSRGPRDAGAVASELEALALAFEGAKGELLRRWNPERGR